MDHARSAWSRANENIEAHLFQASKGDALNEIDQAWKSTVTLERTKREYYKALRDRYSNDLKALSALQAPLTVMNSIEKLDLSEMAGSTEDRERLGRATEALSTELMQLREAAAAEKAPVELRHTLATQIQSLIAFCDIESEHSEAVIKNWEVYYESLRSFVKKRDINKK